MKHVVISTIQRGKVDPAEALDVDNQKMVDASIVLETSNAQHEAQVSRWRAAMDARIDTYERKPAGSETTIYAPAQNLLMRGMGRKPRY